MIRRTSLLGAAVFLALSPVMAAGKALCPDQKLFREKIFNCGQNMVAARVAQVCEERLNRGADSAARELAASMERLGTKAGSAQQLSLAKALVRLDHAIAEMGRQIALLQENADLMADYATAMLDIPGSEGPKTSPPCFNKAFRRLQESVSRVDKKIVETKRARTEAVAMAESLEKSHLHLGNLGMRPVLSGQGKGGPSQAPKAGSGFRPSDISGTGKPDQP